MFKAAILAIGAIMLSMLEATCPTVKLRKKGSMSGVSCYRHRHLYALPYTRALQPFLHSSRPTHGEVPHSILPRPSLRSSVRRRLRRRRPVACAAGGPGPATIAGRWRPRSTSTATVAG